MPHANRALLVARPPPCRRGPWRRDDPLHRQGWAPLPREPRCFLLLPGSRGRQPGSIEGRLARAGTLGRLRSVCRHPDCHRARSANGNRRPAVLASASRELRVPAHRAARDRFTNPFATSPRTWTMPRLVPAPRDGPASLLATSLLLAGPARAAWVSSPRSGLPSAHRRGAVCREGAERRSVSGAACSSSTWNQVGPIWRRPGSSSSCRRSKQEPRRLKRERVCQ